MTPSCVWLPLPESAYCPHAGLGAAPYAQTRICRHYANDFSVARCLVSDEGEFLKRSIHERLGIELQPVFEDGGVHTAEVDVGHQVTLRQVLGLHRRILAVLATLYGVTNDKRCPGSTVVGSRAVVMHAAAKLREQEHEDVVCRVVLA